MQAEKVHKTPRTKPDVRTERLGASLPPSSDSLIVRTQVASLLSSYSRLIPILFYRVGGSDGQSTLEKIDLLDSKSSSFAGLQGFCPTAARCSLLLGGGRPSFFQAAKRAGSVRGASYRRAHQHYSVQRSRQKVTFSGGGPTAGRAWRAWCRSSCVLCRASALAATTWTVGALVFLRNRPELPPMWPCCVVPPALVAPSPPSNVRLVRSR